MFTFFASVPTIDQECSGGQSRRVTAGQQADTRGRTGTQLPALLNFHRANRKPQSVRRSQLPPPQRSRRSSERSNSRAPRL